MLQPYVDKDLNLAYLKLLDDFESFVFLRL